MTQATETSPKKKLDSTKAKVARNQRALTNPTWNNPHPNSILARMGKAGRTTELNRWKNLKDTDCQALESALKRQSV